MELTPNELNKIAELNIPLTITYIMQNKNYLDKLANKILAAAIKDCSPEGLEATGGYVIIGYKDDNIVSLGLPHRFWAQNCTGHPSIIIPIFEEKYNAVSIRFKDIEMLNAMYSSD